MVYIFTSDFDLIQSHIEELGEYITEIILLEKELKTGLKFIIKRINYCMGNVELVEAKDKEELTNEEKDRDAGIIIIELNNVNITKNKIETIVELRGIWRNQITDINVYELKYNLKSTT